MTDVSVLNDNPAPVTAGNILSEVTSHAVDPQPAQRLWKLGERLLITPHSGEAL